MKRTLPSSQLTGIKPTENNVSPVKPQPVLQIKPPLGR